MKSGRAVALSSLLRRDAAHNVSTPLSTTSRDPETVRRGNIEIASSFPPVAMMAFCSLPSRRSKTADAMCGEGD